MILLVAASERGLLAKLYACDTWQGLRVWCCGVLMCGAATTVPHARVLAEVVWNGLP